MNRQDVVGAVFCSILAVFPTIGCAVDTGDAAAETEPARRAAAEVQPDLSLIPAGMDPILLSGDETIELTVEQRFPALQDRAQGDSAKTCGATRANWWGYGLAWSGDWGSWSTCIDWCPAGSHAYSMILKSESNQGGGDDTALNGVALDCWKPLNGGTSRQYVGTLYSSQQVWGSWGSAPMCGLNKPLMFAIVQAETGRGSGDDTAMTNMAGVCYAGSKALFPSIAPNTEFGDWRDSTNTCSTGYAVCGLQTKVEGNQGSGDDTALNGVRMMCCPL